jgi:hypothetical protein
VIFEISLGEDEAAAYTAAPYLTERLLKSIIKSW